ncbi:MAG: hypothetical protein JOY71_14490 [Acetobacteraceae bacterium]|nr:hypothetical protein [Acetobacteraceae bacterium]
MAVTFLDRVRNAKSASSIADLVRQQLAAMDRADALRAAKQKLQKPARRTADAPRETHDATLGGRFIPRRSIEPERSCTQIPSRDTAVMQAHFARQRLEKAGLQEINRRNQERWAEVLTRGKIGIPAGDARNGSYEIRELVAGSNWLTRAEWEANRAFLEPFVAGSKCPYDPWAYNEKQHGKRPAYTRNPV